MLASALPALQTGGFLSGPLGRLLAVIVVIGVVVLVGRIVLRVAWRLVTIAAVIVGLLLLATMFLPGLL
jgi:type IV secretory pathway VirB2 component (pilin)